MLAKIVLVIKLPTRKLLVAVFMDERRKEAGSHLDWIE